MKYTKFIKYINEALCKDDQVVIIITNPKAVKFAFEFSDMKTHETLIILMSDQNLKDIKDRYIGGWWKTKYTQYVASDYSSHVLVIYPNPRII